MAAQVDLKELKGAVECAICLDTLVEPKCLDCNHSYCRSCLDGILRFNPDGGAFIKCPKGCPERTLITNSQTTNDLRFDYVVKNVLDIVGKFSKTDDNPKGGCDYCSKKVVKYCITCEMFMCGECDEHILHDHNDNVHYNVKKEDFAVCCEMHKVDLDWICSCGAGLCIYCRHRQHRTHNPKKLSEIETTLKDEVRESIEAKKNMKTRLPEIKQQIQSAKFELGNVLSRRMINSLADHAAFLREEATLIKQHFSDITNEHYEEIEALDNVEYLESCLLKTGNRFLLQKDRIRSKLVGNHTVPGISISLHDGLFKEDHPLGVLNCGKICHHSPLENNTVKTKFPKVDPVVSAYCLENLRKFIGCSLEMENNPCKKRINSREVKPKTKMAKKQKPTDQQDHDDDDDDDDGDDDEGEQKRVVLHNRNSAGSLSQTNHNNRRRWRRGTLY